jgi:hypothetical protein
MLIPGTVPVPGKIEKNSGGENFPAFIQEFFRIFNIQVSEGFRNCSPMFTVIHCGIGMPALLG